MTLCSGSASQAAQGAPSAGVSIPLSQNLQDKALARNMEGVRHVFFVMSGKGGVGKSSVTVNLAVAFAGFGYKVGVLDVDLHGPSVARLLHCEGPLLGDDDGHILPIEAHGMKVMSMGMLVNEPDTAILWRGAKKTGAIRQFLTEVLWGDLDVLFIDSPPGTGDEHMTVLSALPHAVSIVVTTPQELSLADVRRALDMLRHTQTPVLGLIENMSGLACPHCGEQIDLFKRGGGEALAKEQGLPFLGAVPLDPATVVAADQGVPIVTLAQDSPAKLAFLRVAAAVRDAVMEA